MTKRIIIIVVSLLIVCIGASDMSTVWFVAMNAPISCQHTTSPCQRSSHRPQSMALGYRESHTPKPQPSITVFVRPAMARFMHRMRPVILAAAARHNTPERSGMSNEAFAETIALILYNEHHGWVEDVITPVRLFTPLYQYTQIYLNQQGIGTNFSVWPSNLRPSVALEMLLQQMPLPDATTSITIPLTIEGSHIDVTHYATLGNLYADITNEITQDELAVAYLAANLERGVYRANYEQVPVSWRVLAAWHNQGIVRPEHVQANGYARDYIRRTSAYIPLAHYLIHQQTETKRWAYYQQWWVHVDGDG